MPGLGDCFSMRNSAVAAELRRCGPWIDAAIARSDGEATAQEVVAEVLSGRAQLWAGERSCMVTQLHDDAGAVFIFVWLGGGDLAELMAVRPVLESWGKQHGAISARINGRLGWARLLKSHGYAMAGGELCKTLM